MKQQQVNGNASRGNDRELTFRSLMAGLRARRSLNAEEIQELADALSRLWRERNHLYTNRLARAAKMLQGMIDVDAVEVASTGDATTREIDEVASTGDSTSPEKSVKEGKEKIPPCTPFKEKDQESSSPRARTCVRERFVKPTVEEVAAYIKAKGYTFDAEAFWFFYDSKDWMIGKNKMASWTSACVTWQKKEKVFSANSDTRAGRRTAAPKASNWVGSTAEQRKEFCDGLEG